MKRAKTRFLLLLLLASGITARAQQYPVFTQYYFNELVINPAYAGNHIQLSATAMYRNQWVNFPGAPRTFSFTTHTALLRNKVGVGLMVNHDEIGSYKNDHIYGSYSYMLRFPHSTLAMGLQAGVNVVGANFSRLDLQNPDDLSFAGFNSVKPNFGAGVLYNKKNFFVGFSVPFIINSALTSGSFENIANEIRQKRFYFLRGGTILPLHRSKNVQINPSILVRSQEGQPLSMDLNMAVIFYEVFSVGTSWRSGDAFITFIDLKLSEQFHFAYSYDMTSSALNRFSNGSHEFMINYRTRIRGIHQNVECPSYYNYR
ncbi:MAG: type IX secretion system membrane protein PorP/SprF [Bacteroidota bacterium]